MCYLVPSTGISHACSNSVVRYNSVVDTTDGGIVIFGATGSTVSSNTITAVSRRALGGINLVDYNPFAGSYAGVSVADNTINAASSFIKVGIALGGMTWGSDNRSIARTYGGTVRNNRITSGPGGYLGFGISVAGHNNAVVDGNVATAQFGGSPSQYCIPDPMVPTPGPFYFDPYTTPGSKLQSDFVAAPLVFMICRFSCFNSVQHGTNICTIY